MADTVFREARWRRAGASEKQLDKLRAAHAALTADEQAAEAARVDSISDVDLAVELDAHTPDLVAGSKNEVLARVGNDRELAALALSHEQARPRPRKTVIEALNELIGKPGQDG